MGSNPAGRASWTKGPVERLAPFHLEAMPGDTLAAYALAAYSRAMVFVELTPFAEFRREHWTDEDLRAFQSFLLVSPEAGNLIPGGGGLRKVRWAAQGRGKRGGSRIIYYWKVSGNQIYLVYGYVKSEREDLTPRQVKVLADLTRDLKNG